MFKKLVVLLMLPLLLTGCFEPEDPMADVVNMGNFELIKYNQSLAESKALLGSFGVEIPSNGTYQLRAWEAVDRVLIISFQEEQAKHKSYTYFANEMVHTTDVLWNKDGSEQRTITEKPEVQLESLE